MAIDGYRYMGIRPPPRLPSPPEEVDSDGEEVQLCCQCGLPVGETAYRPEEKVQNVNARDVKCGRELYT